MLCEVNQSLEEEWKLVFRGHLVKKRGERKVTNGGQAFCNFTQCFHSTHNFTEISCPCYMGVNMSILALQWMGDRKKTGF